MNESIGDTAMTCMGDLAHMLELLADRFNQRPLAQQQFVPQRHELVFHVAFELGNQLHARLLQVLA